MAVQYTPEQLKEIHNKKILRLAKYQERLDKICNEEDSKITHWDHELQVRTESLKRMWEEGKRMIEAHRKEAQREIDHLTGVAEQDWDKIQDHFEEKYAEVVNAYYQAAAKIR